MQCDSETALSIRSFSPIIIGSDEAIATGQAMQIFNDLHYSNRLEMYCL